MKTRFSCPIIALSATLTPESLDDLRTNYLRNPVVIKGRIDRPNVSLHITPYRLSSPTECKNNKADDFYALAQLVKTTCDGEPFIVYCSFAAECEKLKEDLLKINVECSSYTGKSSISNKFEAYQALKSGNVQGLVATKAFGMGVNLKNIRKVIHIGLPSNLSEWIQESGRAGRDGQSAEAYLFVNENEDLKKNGYWIKDVDPTSDEWKAKMIDLMDIYKYFCTAFLGNCIREFQLRFFGDNESLESRSAKKVSGFCCTGCEIQKSYTLQEVKEIPLVLQSLAFLSSKGIAVMYENRIVSWVQGKKENWMNMHFDEESLKEATNFGSISSLAQKTCEILVKGILRQCFGLKYLDLQLELFPGPKKIMCRAWKINELGKQVASGTVRPVLVPDPVKVTRLLLLE